MSLETKLLIVVDPTAKTHPAIERTINLMQSELPNDTQEVTILFAIDHSSVDTSADNPAIFRDDKFLLDLIAPIQKMGFTPSIRISWSKDWADSILVTAAAVGATTIMVSHPGEKASRSLSDEFWRLIRNSQVPVGIIQSTSLPVGNGVLAAVDVQDTALTGLNQRILETARAAAARYGSELHLANAYSNSSQYPDRAKIVALTGIANENIHIKAGEPDEALAEINRDLMPDLVVIGATRRTGIKAALRGRKIGQILRTIKRDVLVVV